MEWIREYCDSDTHPQMMGVGPRGREIFRFLLRLSGRHDLGGRLPAEYLDPDFLIAQLGLRCCDGCPVPLRTHVTDSVTLILGRGLLVRNGDSSYTIDGWSRRQPQSALSNAERQRRFRARTVTARNDKVTARNAPEETRGEERRSVTPPNPRKRGSRPVKVGRKVELLFDDKGVPVGGTRNERVFAFWAKHLDHPGALLDPDRERLIDGAFALGYSEDQLFTAIFGCACSPYHQGKNETNRVYDELSLILRNAEKIDSFIALTRKAPLTREGYRRA